MNIVNICYRGNLLHDQRKKCPEMMEVATLDSIHQDHLDITYYRMFTVYVNKFT